MHSINGLCAEVDELVEVHGQLIRTTLTLGQPNYRAAVGLS
jgi:hypothetical protein